MRRERRAANVRKLSPASARVEVVIDELVLHGFAASERYAIGEALARELERRFAAQARRGDFQHDVELAQLSAGTIAGSAAAAPGAMGTQLARAVYAGLSASSRGPTS